MKQSPGSTDPPGEAALERALGPAYPSFTALARPSPSDRAQWKRYGARAGWVLKVGAGTRTLLYLQPGPGRFTATVVLGEKAIAAILSDRPPKRLENAIRRARRYVEGRPVRIIVRGPREVGLVERLLQAKRGGRA